MTVIDWLLESGEARFEMDDGDSRPGRWNTLRTLRVLDWHARPGRAVAN